VPDILRQHRKVSEMRFHKLPCQGSWVYVTGTMSIRQQQEPQLPFAEVISLHQQAVYGYLLRFTRSVHDAQDLFQETFLRAHRAYAALPVDVELRAWLMRIAINVSKNYVRDRQRRTRVLVDEEQGHNREPVFSIHNSSDTEQMMISRETANSLLGTIEALPFHQRTAFIQRQFDGLDYDTIAQNLDCSPESARAHVYQALRKLRLSLSAENPQSAIRNPQSTGRTRQSE
jgi:RNA polymerase sigma-70 factor, ECF subfamily